MATVVSVKGCRSTLVTVTGTGFDTGAEPVAVSLSEQEQASREIDNNDKTVRMREGGGKRPELWRDKLLVTTGIITFGIRVRS